MYKVEFEFALYRYSLPLIPPFLPREGCLLHMRSEENEGWGEVAPYPGRSRETHLRAERELVAALRALKQGAPLPPLCPSAAFCLDSALHFTWPLPPTPLCALLMGTQEEILAQLEHCEGCSHAKIKVAHLSTRDLDTILSRAPPGLTVRLDANLAFTPEEAIKRFSHLRVEFVEDPTHALGALETLPFPFALDEALHHVNALPQTPNLAALVLKPTLIGGRKECGTWARSHPSLLSSCFETGVGLANVIQLSQALPDLLMPMGLDTYRFFAQDILEVPFSIRQGVLFPPKTFVVDLDRLTLVAHG